MALPMEISQDLELITVIGLEHCLAPGNSSHASGRCKEIKQARGVPLVVVTWEPSRDVATLGSVLCAGRCHSKCLWAEWESEGSHNQHSGAPYPGPQTYRAHANSLLISSEESPGHSAEGEVFAEQVPTSTEARARV